MEEMMKSEETTKKSSEMLCVLAILWKALKVTCRNKKAAFFVTVLALPLVMVIAMAAEFVLALPLEEVISTFPHKNSIGSHQIVMVWATCFFAAFLVLGFADMLLVAYSKATRPIERASTHNEKMLIIRRTWVRVTFTWLSIVLFTTVHFVICFSLVCLVRKNYALVAAICVIVMLSYLYLATTWMLALVISISEEDCYGLKAIWKAGELIKGRKLHGFALMILLTALTCAILVFLVFMFIGFKAEVPFWYVTVTLIASLVCLVELFVVEVYTVFYMECKKSQCETIEKVGQDPMAIIVVINHKTGADSVAPAGVENNINTNLTDV